MRIVAFDIGKINFAWAIVDISSNIVERFDLVDINQKSDIYKNVHNYLLGVEHFFKDCETILVEQQMTTNFQALKLSQHVLAFFFIRFPEKQTLEWSACHKTKSFGLQKTTKSRRKQFAVEKVRELIEHDPVVTEMFEALKKKDDVADCILMCISFGRIKKKIN